MMSSATITITKAEIDALIEVAVKEAISKSTAFFEEKLQKQQEVIDGLQRRLKQAEIENNRLEQYSRRSHLRIHGLKLDDGDDCKEAVCRFINTHLSLDSAVQPRDLDAAHKLPLRQVDTEASQTVAKEGTNKARPRVPVIIVRFHARDLRDSVIKSRKQLKGSGISITEDLTVKNVLLLKRLQRCAHFQAAWSWEGKIYAKHATSSRESKPIKFDIFDA
jgi:hypothetical protein